MITGLRRNYHYFDIFWSSREFPSPLPGDIRHSLTLNFSGSGAMLCGQIVLRERLMDEAICLGTEKFMVVKGFE
jgi:hypothetical protein